MRMVLCIMVALIPTSGFAQTFLYGDGVNGILTELTPGSRYYSDEKQNGFINEIAPGVSYYSLRGSDGHTRSGFITDLSGASSPALAVPSITAPPAPRQSGSPFSPVDQIAVRGSR